ncbi:hypothetical protein VFPFJ_06370 [Purpureocillium lilacinum]|uniref:Uncharacterized protein n=1 Tax=Purpureocillium lilacinum TaxID=33203 RepID=A0A179HHP9_PURLI|nr:hypothetical protein VFPFJ_06370 [Purpureocillium lilacinum]OAQ89956.1 hypothetical protein VFPFJ_06370 [Purpureocillium lilacinum]
MDTRRARRALQRRLWGVSQECVGRAAWPPVSCSAGSPSHPPMPPSSCARDATASWAVPCTCTLGGLLFVPLLAVVVVVVVAPSLSLLMAHFYEAGKAAAPAQSESAHGRPCVGNN